MSSSKAYATEQRLSALVRQAGPVLGMLDGSPPYTGTAGNNVAVTHYTIPASAAAALALGHHYRGRVNGTFSTGAGAPTDVTFTAFFNGIGGGQLAALSVPGAGLWANATAAGWDLEFDVHFLSGTEAETTIRLWWHTAAGVAGSVSWFTVGNNSTLTSGGSRDITLAYKCTSASSMSLNAKAGRVWPEIGPDA